MSFANNDYSDYGQNKRMSLSSLIVSYTNHELPTANLKTNNNSINVPQNKDITDKEVIELLSQQISPKSVRFVQQISEDSFLAQLSKPKDAFKCIQGLNNSKFNNRTFKISQKILDTNQASLKKQPKSSNHYSKHMSENYSRQNSGDMTLHFKNGNTYNTADKISDNSHNSSIGPSQTNNNFFNQNSRSSKNQQANYRNSSRAPKSDNYINNYGKKKTQTSSAEFQNSYPSFLDSFLLKQTYQNMFFQSYQYQSIPHSLLPLQLQHVNMAPQYIPVPFYMPPTGICDPQFSAMRANSMPSIHNGHMAYSYPPNKSLSECNGSKDSSAEFFASEKRNETEKEESLGNNFIDDDSSSYAESNSVSITGSSSTAVDSSDSNDDSETFCREKRISPKDHASILNTSAPSTAYNSNAIDTDNTSYQNHQSTSLLYQRMNDSRNYCDPSITAFGQQDFALYMYPTNNYYGNSAYYQKLNYYPSHDSENFGINARNFSKYHEQTIDREESPDIHRLFFGNLSYKTTLEDLKQEIYDRIQTDDAKFSIEMPNNELTKGFAIVQFLDPNIASNAIACFDGTEFHGRKIKVRYDKYPSFAKRNRANRSTFQCYDGIVYSNEHGLPGNDLNHVMDDQKRDVSTVLKEEIVDTEKMTLSEETSRF